MQTHLLNPHAVGIPWLECHVCDDTVPDKTWITSCPFWIGRSDLADLQILSNRISRMHAKILQSGMNYRIQDGGSTNGTVLNGQKVKDTPLVDGDVLQIADIEFTFHSGESEGASGTASVSTAFTQDFTGDTPTAEAAGNSMELIADVRRLHEIITRRCVNNLFQPIHLLEDRTVYGYEAVGANVWLGTEQTGVASLAKRSEFRLTQHLRSLLRLIAVEQVMGSSPESRVFVRLTGPELKRESLLGDIGKLCEFPASADQVVTGIPMSATADVPAFRSLYNGMKMLGLGIAVYDFVAGQSSIEQLADGPPNFLTLSPSMIRGVNRVEERQGRVRTIVQACSQMGCKVIATGIETAEEAETCRQLGCQLGQGDYFEPPQAFDFGAGFMETI